MPTIKNQILSFLLRQFIAMTVISVVLGMAGFGKTAYSLWLASMVYVIPVSCFAAKFLIYSGASAAKKLVKSFYKAEATKLLLTAVLFALVFKFIHVQPSAFFIGFIINQAVFWIRLFSLKIEG